MKTLLTIQAAILLQGCAGEIVIKWTDPDTNIETSVEYTSARRAAITVSSAGVSIITGQLAINDETVRVLVKKD